MPLYRIQGEDGTGPYFSFPAKLAIENWMARMGLECNADHPNHPLPHRDSKLRDALYENDICVDDCLFGFESPEALRRWFFEDQVLKDLHEYGMSLAVYEGDIYHGYTQSIIMKDTERLIETRSLLSLLG